MATRKALVLVSGLFQELNSSSDKLDFAGNSTSDLSEGSNQYFTNTRARSSVSVTDSGGLGSLGYNNSTGVITYAGPSNSDVRGLVSVASGSGLTYNSSTGEFGTNAIPNAQLANSTITLGSDVVSLGDTITGLSLTNIQAITKLQVGSQGGGGNIVLHADSSGGFSQGITFEGASGGVDANETLLAITDPTADRTITLPDATGTVALTSDIVYPVTLTNSVTLTNKTLALGSNTISGTLAQFNTAVTNATLVSTTGTETLTNKSLTAPTLTGSSASAGSIIFKEDTDNGTNSATLKGPASTADVTITLPAETGTVLTTASSIANSNLANSTVTIGSSAVALGSSVTTLTGITSLTADAVVAKANGFRVIDPSDPTKQVAFQASGVDTNTTRTLTVPNKNGSILTEVVDDTSPQLGGDLQSNGNDIDFADNDKAVFGTGSDLKLYYDGNDGIFESTVNTDLFVFKNTGGNSELRIQGHESSAASLSLYADEGDDPQDRWKFTAFTDGVLDLLHFKGSTSNFSTTARFTNEGGTELRHNNVKVFETSASGVGVTGDITVSGTVDGKDIATLATESFATAIAVALG
jgi:hypothetical protein